jgi:hypothetical protein
MGRIEKKIIRVSGDINDLREQLRKDGIPDDEAESIIKEIRERSDDDSDEQCDCPDCVAKRGDSPINVLSGMFNKAISPMLSIIAPMVTMMPLTRIADIAPENEDELAKAFMKNKTILLCALVDSPFEKISYKNISMMTEDAFMAASNEMVESFDDRTKELFIKHFKAIGSMLANYVRSATEKQTPEFVKELVLNDPNVDPVAAVAEMRSKMVRWTTQMAQYMTLVILGENDHAAKIEIALIPMGFRPITRSVSAQH